MAASLGRAAAGWSVRRRLALGAGLATAAGASLLATLESEVRASGLELHAPALPWSHNGLFGQLDAFSMRRGWQVYKEVCTACHSLKIISYYQFVNVFMTEKEAKAEAAEVMVWDGPDDDGKMFQRPGRIGDRIPNPYTNNKAAAAANNGAVPPDLSVIALARKQGIDYIFWLLTSYQDPPAGIKLGPGQAYNPYFPGGIIGMSRQLWDGGVEYPDGTPATTSQQAKDVCTFLWWCADPHHDMRKRVSFKAFVMAGFFAACFFPHWRANSGSWHNTRIAFRVIPGREPHVKADYPVPSVFESAAAKRADLLPLNKPVSGADIAAKTNHLYKSYAPVYDWKENRLDAWWRKFTWTHFNDDFRQYGCLFHDMMDPNDDPVYEEALRRLPPWEKDARARRLARGTVLSVHAEYLPQDLWTRYEDENWYLQPYLDQVEAEIAERTAKEYPFLTNFLRRNLVDMSLGKGKPKGE